MEPIYEQINFAIQTNPFSHLDKYYNLSNVRHWVDNRGGACAHIWNEGKWQAAVLTPQATPAGCLVLASFTNTRRHLFTSRLVLCQHTYIHTYIHTYTNMKLEVYGRYVPRLIGDPVCFGPLDFQLSALSLYFLVRHWHPCVSVFHSVLLCLIVC